MDKSNKKLMALAAAVALLVAFTLTARAQTEGLSLGIEREAATDVSVNSSEFGRFITILQEIQEIQSRAEADIDHIFATSPLNERRFRELHRRMQSATSEARERVEKNQEKQYAQVLTDINGVRRDAHDRMVEAIESKNLSVERFNALILAVREDPTLCGRLLNTGFGTEEHEEATDATYTK